jgi:hypothetical protein
MKAIVELFRLAWIHCKIWRLRRKERRLIRDTLALRAKNDQMEAKIEAIERRRR